MMAVGVERLPSCVLGRLTSLLHYVGTTRDGYGGHIGSSIDAIHDAVGTCTRDKTYPPFSS